MTRQEFYINNKKMNNEASKMQGSDRKHACFQAEIRYSLLAEYCELQDKFVK
jgi:hypothetical protein